MTQLMNRTRFGFGLCLLATVIGCAQPVKPNDVLEVKISLRKVEEPVLDYSKVYMDCTQDLCNPVELSVGDKSFRLLGFSPTIESVERDAANNITHVCLRLGMRHSSLLVMYLGPSEVRGIVLVDQEPVLASSQIDFELIDNKFGDKMIDMSGQKVFAEPQFLETVTSNGRTAPKDVVPVSETPYRNPYPSSMIGASK